MQYYNQFNTINKSNLLPPMTVRKAVKETDKFKMAVMDAFEFIAMEQRLENITKFNDFYRMVNNDMSYKELKEVVPFIERIEEFLADDVEIPSFLKHYDLLGLIKTDLVGKYIDFQDKFHVIETGEIQQNEFLRYKDAQINKALNDLMENEVRIKMAEMGVKEDGQQFNSPEEQQQYMAQLQQMKKDLTPKDTQASAKSRFKTVGVQFGEAVLDQDRARFDLLEKEKESLGDYYLTGRWFREYKIGFESYEPVNWDVRETFLSKDIASRYPQDGEYIGRITLKTPSEVIKNHGHFLTTEQQKELLGGNESWKQFIGGGALGIDSTLWDSVTNNFNKPVMVPFHNYADYNASLDIEDYLGIPQGDVTYFGKDGKEHYGSRYLPRYLNRNAGEYAAFAKITRPDFDPRRDLCQVTEVYCRAYDLFGYLTYEDETTGRKVVEEVTEDILPSLIKEQGIKQSFKEAIVDTIEKDDLEVGTLLWFYRPVCYEGLKIQSGNLVKPIYPYFRAREHQIKGDNMFDIKLPVVGYLGESSAKKALPYQAAHNLVMNQVYNMLEKEIGMFFLVDVLSIPSDALGWGDAQEALINMRNMAKDIGLLPAKVNPGATNTFTAHNLTYQGQIQYRIGLAEFYAKKAFEAIGTNPVANSQPTTYETAEGVKVSNEAKFSQVSEFYETFGTSNRKALEIHLAVAQYCQSNGKDITVAYTRSDATQEFLRISDPKFSLRNIGLIPIRDPKKRKEFETYRQALLQMNTLQSDVLEFAKLFTADTMTEAIDIATRGEVKRMEQAQLDHERQKELIAQKGQQDEEFAQKEFERKSILLDKEIRKDINVAGIQAEGRAADVNSNSEGYAAIDKSRKDAIRQTEIQNKNDIAKAGLELNAKATDDKKALEWAKLKLQTEEMKAKLEMKKIDQNIALSNKN